MQGALIADSLRGFLRDHALRLFDPSIQPGWWIGKRVTTPAHGGGPATGLGREWHLGLAQQ